MAEKNYAAEIRRHMKSLDIYRKEYEPAILTLADISRQYDVLTKQFADGGYQFAELTETGSKKAPIVTTLESLRNFAQGHAELHERAGPDAARRRADGQRSAEGRDKAEHARSCV